MNSCSGGQVGLLAAYTDSLASHPNQGRAIVQEWLEVVGNNKTREEWALSSLLQVLETKVRSQTHLGGFELDVKLMSLIELD